MARRFTPPKVHRGLRLPTRRSNHRGTFLALALLALALPLGLSIGSGGHGTLVPRAAAAAPTPLDLRAPAHLTPHTGATFGDLVVTPVNSPYLITAGPNHLGSYILEGNLTVEAGATLILRQVFFEQEEFITDSGTTAERLSHLYTINIQGTVIMDHAVILSNYAPLNPYSKLDINVSNGGHLLLNDSGLNFPGWISVYGAGSELNLTNDSRIAADPLDVLPPPENATISNDTAFAPSLVASHGAHVNLFDSFLNQTYSDNVSAYGMPGPANSLVDVASHTLTGGAGGTWSTFTLSVPDSENLTRAALYQSIQSGNLTLFYTASADLTSINDQVNFGGALTFGPVAFPAGSGKLLVPFSPAVVAGINAQGFRSFLSEIDGNGASVALGALNVSGTVAITQIALNVSVALDYNMTFTGAGTELTAVDTSLDLNFAPTPGSYVPTAVLPPLPWDSNKLLLQDGAIGYFASVTIPSTFSGKFWNQSAIQPDATSSAVFYRWFELSVQGAGNASAPGADLTAYYGLDANQANNATVTTLNQLGTANAGLAQYVHAQDVAWGVSTYGESDQFGVGRLLLASTVLTSATLPDGTFVGGYHVAVSIPGLANGTQWLSSAVSPYPVNMDPASPDSVLGAVVFDAYAPQVSVVSTSVLVDQALVANGTVAIGQNLTIQVDFRNTGIGPINSVAVALYYVEPGLIAPHLIASLPTFGALAAGADLTVNLTWLVSENVTGRNGTFAHDFLATATWNGGSPPYGGAADALVHLTIVPAYIHLTYTPPSAPLSATSELPTVGTVTFAGRGNATINVTAVGHGGRYFLGSTLAETSTQTPGGTFSVFLQPPLAMPPGTYDLNVTATYNHRVVNLTLVNAVTLQGSTSATSTPWYEQSVLGLPLWIWIVIAAGIAVGVIVFLWFLRSRTKGKLVECGECGELIPETATVCPKCGAEFESDLVRCSRCSSTIPANSAQCPECAAQLLGPETSDPERQGYQDFVEKFRVEARKELGDNYGEGAFWDWFKRQTTYVSFNQWKLQQSQGDRTGMAAPPTGATAAPVDSTNQFQSGPPKGPSGGALASNPAPAPRAPSGGSAATPPAAAGASGAPRPAPASPAPTPAASGGGAGPAMKACGNCGKEIPPDYLVCPFCGAVTR